MLEFRFKIPVPIKKEESAAEGAQAQNMNNKRRNRSNVARSRSPDLTADGVYNNDNFLHSAAGLVGTSVQIELANGSQYIGIFSTFSSQFDVVLEYVQRIINEKSDTPDPKNVLRKMIFPKQNIVQMEVKNIDPLFASKDGSFQTDLTISKFDRNGQTADGEKELQPWIGDCNGEDLESGLSLEEIEGWDANEMFKRNEEKYGVISSFDHSLSGYTLPLERSESKGFKEAEARAARIANEIERNPKTQARLEMENGDEEDRFAAVQRPADDRNSPPRGGLDKSNKYIPPVRRQGYHGRLNARSTPFPPGRTPPAQPVEEPPEPSSPAPDIISSQQVAANCEDNRNNNASSPSGSLPPANSPSPNQPLPPRNSNGARKGYNMPGYPYSQQPRYPPPAPPQIVSHRPLPPSVGNPQQAPQPMQHGPPPPQPMPIVFGPPIPPNHQPSIQQGPPMPPDAVSQPLQVQQANHPPNQSMALMQQSMEQQGMREQTITHVHLPPHGVPHVHPSGPVLQGYVQVPRDHDLEIRGHRSMGIRGQAPRVFQPPNAKRFPAPFPPPQAVRKSRGEEVQELAEFSNNLKLAGEDDQDDKHDSPPLEQWNKGRSPPSNPPVDETSSALKKSTLNPNAKEFVYNPSANKPYTPRPPNTPGPSRPHTPQTPAQPFGYSPGPMPTVMMPGATYVMQSTFPHQSQPPRVQITPRPEITSSQMQVAAATGQPLLAPAPMQRFMAPYPNPPPQHQYQQMVRMVPSQGTPVMFQPDVGPHVQYMSQHAPQAHPGGQFPQPQHQQFPATMLYSMPIPQTTMLQYFQQPHPQPGQQQHVQVIVPNP